MARKQWAKVVDLNKCLGCQECSVTCKMWWTQRDEAQHMWWSIVETRPGPGYPRNWEKLTANGEMPEYSDYEVVPSFDYGRLQSNKARGNREAKLLPTQDQKFGPNWYEDVGKGDDPGNAWYFYLHLSCMHCSNPACLNLCPNNAISKREDGIVLIDQNVCQGCKTCLVACPYKRVFWNPGSRVTEKCIMCYPRLDEGKPPICVQACSGKAIFFGDLYDPTSPVAKLVRKYQVALPLHSEYGTKPNMYYIPPVLTPVEGGTDRDPGRNLRIPLAELHRLFGSRVDIVAATLAQAREDARRGRVSELVEILTGYPTYKL